MSYLGCMLLVTVATMIKTILSYLPYPHFILMHIHLTGVSQVHSLSRFQPEVGCVPRPSRDGRLAGGIPPHGSSASLPSRMGSLHHNLPMPDDPPLDGTFIQKVSSVHTILPWVSSGTSIMQTPLVPSKVFWVERCPILRCFRYISGRRLVPLNATKVCSRSLPCCTLAKRLTRG